MSFVRLCGCLLWSLYYSNNAWSNMEFLWNKCHKVGHSVYYGNREFVMFWYSTFLEFLKLSPQVPVPSLSVCSPLVSSQRFGRSWWSSRNAWTNRQRWGSSCCRTSRTSSGRRLKSKWSIPETWRNWPNASWQRHAAPRTTSSTSKKTKSYCLFGFNSLMSSGFI